MDKVLLFIENNMVALAIAVIFIWIAIVVIKSVLRWVLTAVIVLGVIYMASQYIAPLGNITQATVEATKAEFLNTVEESPEDVEFKENNKGQFIITYEDITLAGNRNSNKAQLRLKDKALLTLDVEGVLKQFVDKQLQENSTAKD